MFARFWRSGAAIPLGAFLFGLFVSVAAALRLQDDARAQVQAEFRRSVEQLTLEISRRFRLPVHGLNGARGLYVARSGTTRAEFRAYVESRDLPREFPGVRGIGFVERLERGDVDAFMTRERADGAPQFAIRDLKDPGHDLFIIRFIEPAIGNEGAQGLDLGSEARRRRALQRAIDSGEATLSAPVTLVQDQRGSPGALLYQPVYVPGSRPRTVEERRAALAGLLYAPIVIGELLEGVAGVSAGLVEFDLFDAEPGDSMRVYALGAAPAGPERTRSARQSALFHETATIALPGRAFTLNARSTPRFDVSYDPLMAWYVFAAGLVASALLATLLWQQASGRRRAEALAQGMTADLERLAQVVKSTSNAVTITDRELRINWVNEGFTRISGYAANEALGRTPGELLGSGKADPAVLARLVESARAGTGCRVEILNRAKGGREYWVDTEILPIHDAQGALTGFMEVGSDVTQRRLAQDLLEAALRENMALLRTIDMHAIVSVADRAGRITEVNDAFCRISGYGRAELIGANHRIVNSGVQPAGFWVDMWRTVASGTPWRGEVCNRAKDGSLYWVETIIAPFANADGRIEKYVSIRVDITPNKAAEAALLASQSFLDKTGRIGGVGGWELDLKTQTLLWTDQTCRIHEVDIGHCPTLQEAIDFFVPQVRPIVERAVQHSITSGEGFDIELPCTTARGRSIWVRMVGEAESLDGDIVRLVGALQDITARRNLESDQHRSDQLLRAAIDVIDEAFVLYDPDDRLVFCNDKYRSIYAGVADLIVPGVSFERLIRTGAERGQYTAALGRVDAWVAERLAAHRAGNTTLVQQHVDGRSLRIIERKMPDGHIVGFRVDITELVRATEAAQEASRAKTQFLANMSHEIRTPMNAVLGMLALLRRTPLTSRQADYAAKTEGAARSLLGLLNDILDFAKADAGKMTLDPQPFRVDTLLRELSVILSGNVGDKNLEVLFNVDPNLPDALVGDAMRLQQVLINLAGNAIKFTPRGEVEISLDRVAREADAVTLRVAVRDTGVGIAPENQARIFSGFTQAEASTTRRFGGTGLGVAISQRLVALMGGNLELESELGRGSRFHFCIRLPIDMAAPTAVVRAMEPRRVLVIDANAATRDALAGLGRSLGWSVDVAEHLEAALQSGPRDAAQGRAYQAVFFDAQMPGSDAFQTCRTINARGLTEGPLLAMVRGQGREPLALLGEAESVRPDGVLVKPLTASMLLEAVLEARLRPTDRSGQLRPAGGQRLVGLRLLVVEDNLNNQQVARELLEDEGAFVQIAVHGQDALDQLATTQPFDAVLMDLQMPVMDGFTATRLIRTELHRCALPIIAMTANAMASDREACLAAGMNDHVGKPFDLNHLVSVLRRHSGRGDATVEAADLATRGGPSPLQVDAAAAAGVDLSAALRRLGGSVPTYQRLLRRFTADLRFMPEKLQAMLARAESDDLKRELHTLKGVAATLGALPLAAAAAEGELQLAVVTAPELVRQSVERLCASLRAALPALADLLQVLQPAPVGAADPEPPIVDTRALRAALVALARLLKGSDMAALNAFSDLQRDFGSALGESMQALEEAIGALDFEPAARLCDSLAAAQTEAATR